MRSPPRRFSDTGETRWSFHEEILVECPRCGRCALDRALGTTSERRLTCASCGYSRCRTGREGSRWAWWEPVDGYFQAPLWLRAPCLGREVWALNDRHLDYLERFVAADLRERSPAGGAWHNGSLISRLPGFLKDRRHRAAVLAAIEAMRAKLR